MKTRSVTGEMLYSKYSDAMLEQGIGVDSWEDLDESDKAAWDAVAGTVWYKDGKMIKIKTENLGEVEVIYDAASTKQDADLTRLNHTTGMGIATAVNDYDKIIPALTGLANTEEK